MRAVPTSLATVSVTDYKHPVWCDLSKCEPRGEWAGRNRPANGAHYSVGTTINVQTDEVEVSLELVHLDDIHTGTGANVADTSIRLSLLNLASEHPNGGEEFADANLDASDARLIAALLTRYADRADRQNAHGASNFEEATDLPPRGRAVP